MHSCRRRGLVTACAASLQAAFLYTLSAWNPNGLPGEDTWSPTASRLYASLLYFGSPLLSSLAAATLLALFLRSDPLHSRIASALSAPVFSLPAKLSFCLYLVHERACLWLLMYLMPSGLPALAAVAPVSALAIHIAAALAAGYALAYMLHALVEKRFG